MQDIVFVHGMFQNSRSWDNWAWFFGERGYNCIVPDWPLHEGEPAALRANPPEGLGDLYLEDVVRSVKHAVAKCDNPVMIGHSAGGLITQILLNDGLIGYGVAINSVAPNSMLDFDWAFLKNSMAIANPLKGNEPIFMDIKTFHSVFANTLAEGEAAAEFERTVTHDSRNVLRDCMGPWGHVDMGMAHGPLLLIAGGEDRIIPAHLVEKNFKAYKDKESFKTFREFSGRSHYICNEPGWEEVADYVAGWLDRHVMIGPVAYGTGEQARHTTIR